MKELAYPNTPGWTEPTTSRDAAKAMSSRSGILCERVLRAIGNAGPAGLTADQAVARIGETVLAVRPRLTELKWSGKIERTGERRANASSIKAQVWRMK